MAFPSDAQRAKQRREEENRRAREENLRQQELERRAEEERERQREEERRQEALQQAKEFEAALEAAEKKRAELLSRIRSQRRSERRAASRQEVRHQALLEILREANRQEQQETSQRDERQTATRRESAAERQQAEREEERRESRQAAVRKSRQEEQRESARTTERTNDRRESARQGRRDAQRAAAQNAEQAEADREASRESRRQEERASTRASESRQVRREENRARATDREQEEANRQAINERRSSEQQQEQQAAVRQSRQAEQRATERRATDVQERRDEQRATERRAAQVQERRDEQRDTERRANQAQERREQLRENTRSADRAARAAGERSARQRQEQNASERSNRDPLQDRISTGSLSGSLPWLRVAGNQITTLVGQPVVLRGVNLLGLDSAEPDVELGFAAGAGITGQTIDAILSWDVNIIRLAINHRRVLQGSGNRSAWDYLSDLDWIIEQAASRGAYMLLSLRRLDDVTVFGTRISNDGQRAPNFIAPQPDYDAIGLWRLLGERYQDEPAVLFDLYASPHRALDDDLTGFNTDWERWTIWVRLLVAELRRMHPRALCFVSGLDWATDLAGFPVTGTDSQAIPNLVYAVYLYPQRGASPSAIRALARSHPVFVSEWGGGLADVGWGEQTLRTLTAAGCSWTAAHWNDDPRLAQMTQRGFVPSPFGSVIRRALALNT